MLVLVMKMVNLLLRMFTAALLLQGMHLSSLMIVNLFRIDCNCHLVVNIVIVASDF